MSDILSVLAPALPTILAVVSILIVAAVLLQTRGAQFSGAFSDTSGATHYRRRGAELFLFRATIVLGFVFAGLSLLSLIAR